MRLQLLSDLHFEFHRDGGRSFVDSLDPEGIETISHLCGLSAALSAVGAS